MAKNSKKLIIPRVVKGFSDISKDQLDYLRNMINKLRNIYQQYGFDEIETPMFEYTEVLGKFLPDSDRPNDGVFSLQDEDEQWLSLRYDLTAPLARYVAENFERLPKPYKSYRYGWVFRNEKAGPDRYRQFLQFDADIVGTANMLADAEICMMAADALIQLDINRANFNIRVNNRKILDGILQQIGITADVKNDTKLTILRAIDKLDKFGIEGVKLLLAEGRMDESGDFTKGAELAPQAIDKILAYLNCNKFSQEEILHQLSLIVGDSAIGQEGIEELKIIQTIVNSAGYSDCIKIDPSIVRGLEYYTGPVFEATLEGDIPNEDGQIVVFGSIGGGGRYDGLIDRFRSDSVPATGFSIGISRLLQALKNLRLLGKINHKELVVVAVMDKDLESLKIYQNIVQKLRSANIASELYVGSAGLKAQMKYADKRGAACIILQGTNEREKGVVEIKDLVTGLKLSEQITSHNEWKELRPAQITIKYDKIIPAVKDILDKVNK
ncbi:histidine--tRNA ligase [Bartonella sp. DGB1]|uniref:histidine--tRNA ligase n=1 Tax=Bartonella sp. DGB1 TaxID=3239807 RepID=UPI0035242976